MKLTGLDSAEIPRYTYDEANNSSRVTIVAGDLNVITNSIKEGLKDLKTDITPQKEQGDIVQVQKIEVPVIVKELEIVQVPQIVREVQIIEVPVIVSQKELEIVTIEKPIIVKEFEKIEVPVITVQKEVQVIYVDKLNYKLLFIIQAITLALVVLSKYIK